jgi:hypothetical protein
MARLFSCCSSACFTVFVTFFVLGFLIVGVPGMADEPIVPPVKGPCYNPNDGECPNGNINCGSEICCQCYCNGDADYCCDCFNPNSCLGTPTCQRMPWLEPDQGPAGLAVARKVAHSLLPAATREARAPSFEAV